MRRRLDIRLFPADFPAGRRRAAKSLVALGTLLAFVSLFAIWVERQALDTDDWVQTSSGMLENAQIRGEVSDFLVEKLYENVDVEGELESVLPGVTKELAGGLADGGEVLAEGGAEAALETSTAQSLWEVANRTAHEELLEVLEDKNELVGTGGGDVSLNLEALLRNVAEQIGIDQSVVEKLPAGAAQIEIVHSDQLSSAETGVTAIRGLALVLSLLTLAVFALAIYLSRGARGATVLMAGTGLIVAGLAVLILRIVAGHLLLDQLVTNDAAEPAAEAAWSIGTSLLADIAWTSIVVGALVAAAGWLGSMRRSALHVRRLLAPSLERRPALFYGGLVAVVGIYFVSGSSSGTRDSLTVLVLVGFAVVGIRALRAQTGREFPDATDPAVLDLAGGWAKKTFVGSGLAERISALRLPSLPDRSRRAAASAREGTTPEATPPLDEETRLGRLAQLGTLRDRGIIDEDEFAVEKARLMQRRAGGEDGAGG